MAEQPHLPDDIIRHILSFLPTKSAIRMTCLSKQLEFVWCSLPVIDLDQGKPCTDPDHEDIPFTNVLISYVRFRIKSKGHPHPPLDKVRLCMGMTPFREYILEKLLTSFALESSLKELDLKCLPPPSTLELNHKYLSFQALVDVKSLTRLSLESLKIKDDVPRSGGIFLPSLKTVSLKSVHLSEEFLCDLIARCPSIEYLSLTRCFGFGGPERNQRIRIADSRTLKYLEINDCSFMHV